jgi:Peptidase A4 family
MSRRAGFGGGSQSTNWAGYSVTAAGTAFVDVKGSWVEPSLDCSTSGPGSSAFWVGLGGFADGSKALEQVGTAADCVDVGFAIHSAWHELVPAPVIDDDLEIAPGDVISAEVSADGTAITLQLHDLTTGESAVTQTTVTEPDLSSAEWIAEAPSLCSPFNPNGCRIKPLANFGTVAFATGSATAGAHTGAIADPAWTTGEIQLVTQAGTPVAEPSDLSADGSSFTVRWISTGAALRLSLQQFVMTPATPRAGRTFTAALRVKATDPAALADATTTCAATIGGKATKARAQTFASGRAACVWQISADAAGRVISGSVTATAHGETIVRRFSRRIGRRPPPGQISRR